MCRVPTGRALCARIANTLLLATVLSAAYTLDRGHHGAGAHAQPSAVAAVQPTPAAAACRPLAGRKTGNGYEWSNSIGPPAGPLPSWWTIALPAWPRRT